MMTVRELQALKDKIEQAKSDKARAQGAIEQIEASWVKDFECHSKKEVEDLIEESRSQIKNLEEKRDKLMLEIEEAVNRSSL